VFGAARLGGVHYLPSNRMNRTIFSTPCWNALSAAWSIHPKRYVVTMVTTSPTRLWKAPTSRLRPRGAGRGGSRWRTIRSALWGSSNAWGGSLDP